MQDIIVPPLNKEAAEIVHKTGRLWTRFRISLAKLKKWLKNTPLFAARLILKAKLKAPCF